MKKQLVTLASVLVLSTAAFAHNVHAMTKMGTVKRVQEKSIVLIMSDGDLESVSLSPKTAFLHSDDHAAKKSELAAGMRIVVKMTSDGKSAATVKMSAARRK